MRTSTIPLRTHSHLLIFSDGHPNILLLLVVLLVWLILAETSSDGRTDVRVINDRFCIFNLTLICLETFQPMSRVLATYASQARNCTISLQVRCMYCTADDLLAHLSRIVVVHATPDPI